MADVNIDTINAAITALLAKDKWDYSEGDITVKLSDQMLALLRARESLLKNPTAEISVMAFDFDINEFGQDKTQYEP